MKLKLKLLFLVCIGMFNVQAQTAKKVLLKTNASANKTALKLQLLMAFCHFTTTKGDITAQLEYEKTPLPLPISLPLQKGRILL
jgi:hypothetical protein